MIYDLIMEGSDLGVFSDYYCTGPGQFKLLWFLIMAAALMKLPEALRKKTRISLEVFYFNTNLIGFVLLNTAHKAIPLELKVSMCAIVPAFRGRGHGKAMIRTLIERLPVGTKVTVSCTKFASRMQAICRRLCFNHIKQQMPAGMINLQVYQYNSTIGSGKTRQNTSVWR